MLWLKFIFFFLLFWLLRYFYYRNKLHSINAIFKEYILYIAKQDNSFIEKKNSAISLLKDCGIKNFSYPNITFLTPNHFQQNHLDGFENLHYGEEKFVGTVNLKFQEAIGIFKARMKQSYNPFYWLEFILKLPEKTMIYLSPSVNESFVKVIQIFYWLVSILFGLNTAKIIDMAQWF
ncbi:MAG: hypothetical protein KA536_06485 [Saprospiraceae bacterium]|nr:hypothetical protein [Saprospiraceae bacterium]